ncbi:HAMP domain-containing sensor histidine kinase [Kineococcus rubinsiae]|uniref:HAMP domain-containing sensor histidine kinase n=1 Tax=Kineococcus rubinsiae TaxID=2609562 RepID=UPI00142F7AF2|nr:HAMP domain-containing sensor histidine kinase [Kineococcus rubinsiae]NIZ91768.1 HAMP domain-containing histidine kinase [Kineococcus rubinsiae]
MRTVSLRRRVVLSAIAVLALLLVAVGVFVDLSLGARLRSDAEGRLRQLTALAVQLDGTVDAQTLADRLTTAGALATLDTSSGTVVGRPGPPPGPGTAPAPRPAPTAAAAAPVTVRRAGDDLVARQELAGGDVLELSTSLAPVQEALDRFRVLMTTGSLAGLLLAAVVLHLLLGRALRPLDTMTATARSIAGGDRGRRLSPDRQDTELGRAATAFDAMLEDLEGAERQATDARDRLQQFLSDAAHELRTPLAGVTAAAEELLLDTSAAEDGSDGGALRERRERSAVRIVREARRASRLVTDLLTASRLEEVAAQLAPVDVGALVRGVLDASPSAGAGRVEVAAAAGAIAVADADAGHVRQVVENLVGNALRAAGTGRVRVEVARPAVGGARVVVSDDGPGVPPAERERVFDRLVRLDPARGDGGAGLGLSIARGLAEAGGGHLRCAAPGEPGLPTGTLPGAVFVLDLPVPPGA